MAAAREHLPIFFDVRGARVLVVGAGAVAARRVLALLSRGARVTVVSRRFGTAIRDLAREGGLETVRGPFRPEQLDGASLAFAATSDRAENARVAREARRRGIPVNAADAPEDCSFIMPAVVAAGAFTLAVSTGGRHPGAARALREYLDERRDELSVRLERGRRRSRPAARQGKVYIVGAGPGDPDLLTVRALGLLRSADAVIHDYLVPREILSLAPSRAVTICYARRGRTAGHGAALKQDAIHRAMVRLARDGKSVVRLKSGDPLLFGRGGEEARFLARAGVEFEIVPGITAAVGCAAAANIPLTQRGLSSSATFLAGHETDDKAQSAVDWDRVPLSGTVAVYMGVARAGAVAEGLARAGFPPDTPFAAVENGCRPEQRVVRGVLADLPRIAKERRLRSPAILFIGRTARPHANDSIEEPDHGPVAQSL